jgi:hypothetical protein
MNRSFDRLIRTGKKGSNKKLKQKKTREEILAKRSMDLSTWVENVRWNQEAARKKQKALTEK